MSDTVRDMYEEWAESYASLMDSEIEQAVYARVLGNLAAATAGINGPVVDTSCGSGHMLAMYSDRFDANRQLIGIDISPAMIKIAHRRFGTKASFVVGDMGNVGAALSSLGGSTPPPPALSAAAVISFFSIHHLDAERVLPVLRSWHDVLAPGGRLLIAAWEGTGTIDYGDSNQITAYRYSREEITSWASLAGFTVTRCTVEAVEGMGMDAVYLEGSR